MNFDKVIASHSAWKHKLKDCLEGRCHLDPAEIRPDNKCELGQWIYNEGQKFDKLPAYHELKTLHREFHKHTAEIVVKINDKKKDEAEADLKQGSTYSSLSSKIVQSIMKLQQEVAE